MKQLPFHKKYIVPACISAIAVFGTAMYVFLRSAAEPEEAAVSVETYDIVATAHQGPLTEQEKQETYQAYIKAVLTEDIQSFCGENVSINPVYNGDRELEGVTLVVDGSGRLEEDTELQIIKTVSTAYGLQPDQVDFSYR